MVASNNGSPAAAAAVGNTPDLASVLRALSDSYKNASRATPVAVTEQQGQQGQSHRSLGVSAIGNDADSSSNSHALQQQASNAKVQSNVLGHDQGISQGQESNIAGTTSGSARPDVGQLGDPSMITTWPAALKYVMKTVGQDEYLQATIRKLIHLQHENEKKWRSERNALLEKQRSRAGKQKQLDDVLRAIGGAVTSSPTTRTVEEDQKELRDYDLKVYRELVSVSRMLDRDLRSLGIPFFAIHHDLVRQSGSAEPTVPSTPASKGYFTARELGELQKRILGLLEDLCKE